MRKTIYDYHGEWAGLPDNGVLPNELAYMVPVTEFWGSYRFCALTYNSRNKKFYMVGGAASRDGSSKIVKFSDIRNPLADAVVETLATGHSNDITYDAFNNRIIIAGGMASNDGSAENTHSKKLFFIDNPDTMQLSSYKSLSDACQGVEYIPDFYGGSRPYSQPAVCVWTASNGTYTATIYDTSISTVLRSGTVTKTQVANYLRVKNPDVLYSQGISYDYASKRLLWNLSYRDDELTSYSNFKSAIQVELDIETFAILGATMIDVTTTEEYQGATFVNGIMYAVSDVKYGTFRIYNPWIHQRETRKWIPPQSDLDNYYAPGHYFSNSGSNTATLSNAPVSDKGFSLHVMIQGSDVRKQRVEANGGSIWEREYTLSNGWGNWYTYSTFEVTGSSEQLIGE